MDKFCEDCIHNEVCQYGAIPPHIGRCNDKDTLDDLRPQGVWINEYDYSKCPFCGMSIDYEVHWLYSEEFNFNFCPNCGARLEGSAE